MFSWKMSFDLEYSERKNIVAIVLEVVKISSQNFGWAGLRNIFSFSGSQACRNWLRSFVLRGLLQSGPLPVRSWGSLKFLNWLWIPHSYSILLWALWKQHLYKMMVILYRCCIKRQCLFMYTFFYSASALNLRVSELSQGLLERFNFFPQRHVRMCWFSDFH